MVFCALSYYEVPLEPYLGCSQLIRADDNEPPRYIVCDASVTTNFGPDSR